jgi:hypothetical protein
VHCYPIIPPEQLLRLGAQEQPLEFTSDKERATMPPAKKTTVTEDSRSDASTVRERQIAAAAHARKSKQNAAAVAAASARENGSALKELAAASADADNTAQAPGVSLKDTYCCLSAWD